MVSWDDNEDSLKIGTARIIANKKEFGIIPQLPVRIRNKRERYGKYRDRSLAELKTWQHQLLNQTAAIVN